MEVASTPRLGSPINNGEEEAIILKIPPLWGVPAEAAGEVDWTGGWETEGAVDDDGVETGGIVVVTAAGGLLVGAAGVVTDGELQAIRARLAITRIANRG
jgi:hypothetical protein